MDGREAKSISKKTSVVIEIPLASQDCTVVGLTLAGRELRIELIVLLSRDGAIHQSRS
jgi:hypothetical protein